MLQRLTRIHPVCWLVVILLMAGCGSDSNRGDTDMDSDTMTGPDNDDGQANHDDDDDGQPMTIDLTGAILTQASGDCADYKNEYESMVRDVNRSMSFTGELAITITDDHCVFASNAIPNHDFNDGDRTFVTAPRAQSSSYRVPRSPTAAASPTALSLRIDNAVFLNGVKLDLLAAGCSGVGDGKIGCFQAGTPFRFDPMSATADFGTDSHNAHTQPDGTYHYHGNPQALFADDDSAPSPTIGFAADGFPIRGSYATIDGSIRKLASSYQLKSGTRAASGGVNPGGMYDGTFVDDYEYVAGSGDLDACNGMSTDGVYAYYVTDSYPWVMGCFTGTPDDSFNK
jgi:hypothetical protein